MVAPRFQWIRSPNQVFPNGFRIWSIRKRRRIHEHFTMRQPAMLQWVRRNAVWKNRTWMARVLFEVNISTTTLTTTVTFRHGVFYGFYLENYYGRRYAIIGRAVDYWGPRMMAEVQRIMDTD